MGRRAAALLCAAVLVAVIAALIASTGGDGARGGGPAAQPRRSSRPDAVWPAGRSPAPGFALRDQSNRRVSLAGRRGRVVLLAFLDSHCKIICKLEGPTIRAALASVPARVPVSLLVVSVNPWQDTPASTRAAAARWRLAGDWHWLRGSPARLRRVWRAYRIVVRRTARDVSHSTAVYLIDRRGYERAGFNYPFAAGDLARSLGGLGARGGA